MWRVFNEDIQLLGFITLIESYEIVHHFFECDTLSLVVPNDMSEFALLKEGNLLNLKGSEKAYRIHSVEVSEEEGKIFVNGYGLECVTESRVIIPLENYENERITTIMEDLMTKTIISPVIANRKVNHIVFGNTSDSDKTTSASYYGENLYSVMSEMTKSHGVAFRFRFDPIGNPTPSIYFDTFEGKDRTVNQSENNPVRWSAKWGDIGGTRLIESTRNYKNVVYTYSGDDSPISVIVDNENKTGWNRKEMTNPSIDINGNTENENGVKLTEAQIRSTLESRGKLSLFRNYKQNDFTFFLSPDVNEIFGEDFDVGDSVSVVDEKYGVEVHKRIITVRETMINNVTEHEVIFEK